MSIAADKANDVIALRDPATGSTLSVIPVPQPAEGVATEHRFVEFTLLPTAQGIAVQNIVDTLTVTAQKGIVGITAAGGLAISPEMTDQLQQSEANAAMAHTPPTLFPYARWKLEDEKQYVPTQLSLYHDIAFNKPDLANKARLKLLGLYMGEGLFPETLSVADDILRASLKVYKANKVTAARGAANFFLYRIRDAERDFASPRPEG